MLRVIWTLADFNNVGYLEEGFNLSYDNSSWMKMLDPIISILFNVNRKMEGPLKFVNKQEE